MKSTQQKMICYNMRCVNAFFIDITNIFVNMTDFSCHFNQKDTLRIPNECLCVILTYYFNILFFAVYHHFSGLGFIAELNFWCPPKTVTSCNKFKIIIIIIIFFRRVFSECTEAIATSLIQLVTNFPEICAFIIGFSFTVWTKMRPLLAH